MINFTSRLISAYSTVVGSAIIGLWILLFATDQVLVPSNPQTPIEIAYHLAAESVTAILLIASGVGLLTSTAWSRTVSPIALGMLLYTVINSAGFYAHQSNIPMVGMFSTLTILTSVCIITVFRL